MNTMNAIAGTVTPHHEPTNQEMALTIAQLKAENERLKANKATPGLGIKISEKGAISVYGLGRWPVTLYASQWIALLEKADEIKTFIQANLTLLAKKEVK